MRRENCEQSKDILHSWWKLACLLCFLTSKKFKMPKSQNNPKGESKSIRQLKEKSSSGKIEKSSSSKPTQPKSTQIKQQPPTKTSPKVPPKQKEVSEEEFSDSDESSSVGPKTEAEIIKKIMEAKKKNATSKPKGTHKQFLLRQQLI